MGRQDDRSEAYWADVAAGYQRAIRSFDALVKPVLRAAGVSSLGLPHVLFLINVGDGDRRVADLVRAERYQGSNASYALGNLIQAGLVERLNDDEDRRVRVVRLTENGRELLSRIRDVSRGDSSQIGAALETISAFEDHVESCNPPRVVKRRGQRAKRGVEA